ncbi:hypothetical protein Fcan01_08870 [Folsomia candida]|uniref:Uncharacterized protein n=1 Tax=Folsomia candida TaxID=158441 RepID=A0A226EF63_FOLCA|nr:hypothetical protein Fcan01_08870 [Folsomia candida]
MSFGYLIVLDECRITPEWIDATTTFAPATPPRSHILNVWSSGTERVGHATLSLSNGGYISLWPGGDSVRSDNLFKKLPAQGVFETDFKRDIINERGKPDLQFNIPPHLLDSDKVIQWKKSYEGDGVYKLKGMNCANAVEKALNSGGLYLLGGSHHGFAKIRVPLASDESFGVKFKTPLLTLPQGILNRVKLTLAVMESGTFFRTVYILIHMGSSFCLIPGVIYCCKKIASFYPENIFSFSRFVRDFVREFFR